MKRNPTLSPNFMLGYAIAAPNLQNYGSQGRRGLDENRYYYSSQSPHYICEYSV
ncbi:hypothetical protein [Nostoc sp. NMS1]|uniref:hypothetical protein n=1 Tax=Nostoc sp. NMS1 TaxID=2815388 RepID=UPI0025E1A220|nr:hypothetical protein [Nostoc sp. NMS1]